MCSRTRRFIVLVINFFDQFRVFRLLAALCVLFSLFGVWKIGCFVMGLYLRNKGM